MNKENKKLIIGFSIILLISIVYLLIHIFIVAQSPVDKIFDQKVNLKEVTLVNENYPDVKKKYEAYSLNGKKLGYVYEGNKQNNWGHIELYVAVIGERVYAIDKVINQSVNIAFTRSYLLNNYWGITYPNIDVVDGAAGATTVGDSRATAQSIIQEVVNIHFEVEPDYIAVLLGVKDNEYTIDAEYKGDVNHYEVTVEGKKVSVFEYNKEVSYKTYQPAEGMIGLYLAIDEEGKILNILLPDKLYKHSHSGSGYGYEVSNAYVTEFKDGNIADGFSIPAGATQGNSVMGIYDMLEEIKEVYDTWKK